MPLGIDKVLSIRILITAKVKSTQRELKTNYSHDLIVMRDYNHQEAIFPDE